MNPFFGSTFGPGGGGGGGGVTTVNGLNGAVNILPGPGISVTTASPNITIAALSVIGTSAAPILITAAGGIPFVSTTVVTKIYIAGNGGPVVVTANPQVAAGTVDGQELVLQGCNAVNTVELQNGTGLALNGAWFAGLNNILTLSWDNSASLWVEMGRQ